MKTFQICTGRIAMKAGNESRIVSRETRYKMVVSVLFGLLGFGVNFASFEFIQFPPYKATLPIGLLFPLLIALTWGWSYGLLAALAGGCQSMWWLWKTGGYAVVYAVPVFTLWIVWHGAWADWGRSRESYWWMRDELRLVADSNGNPIGLLGYWVDINDS